MNSKFKAVCKTVLMAQNREELGSCGELLSTLPEPVVLIVLGQLAQMWVSGPIDQ